MSARHIPGLVFLYLTLCVVVLVSAHPDDRSTWVVGVTAIFVVAALAGAFMRGASPDPAPPATKTSTTPATGSGTPDRSAPSTSDETSPAPAAVSAPASADAPRAISSFDAGGGLYYVRNAGRGAAVNVFVVGVEGDSVTTVELGALAAGASTLLPRQVFVREAHLVVAESPSHATQWHATVCTRTAGSHYVTAAEVAGLTSPTERMTWATYRERHLRDAESRLLPG